MKALVGEERPLTEGDIRDFNRILIRKSFWKDAITPDAQPSRIEKANREVPFKTIDFILDKVLQAARHHYPK